MKKILIVDDQPEVARLLEIILRREDRQLLFASTGEEGLAVAHKFFPDLILMDIMMPGEMDGYEATRRLKQDPATASLHILVMTAKVREEDRRQAIDAGADGYMTKPFDVSELKSRVDKLLSD